MSDRVKKILIVTTAMYCLVIVWKMPSSLGQKPRDAFSKWRPTHELAGVRYAGSNACAQCHAPLTGKRLANTMSRALEPVARCEVLQTHPRLSFRNGPFSYQIVREGNRSLYTISDGTTQITEPILYCFGQGKAGQTYVLQHNGVFYESRVSYYQETQGLDFTIVHPRSVPASVEDGIGRPMSIESAQGCFACHSTAAVSGSQLQLDHMVPGITCEGCHGPGENHIAAIKAGQKNLQIFNPAKLDADELAQEFCGACHVGFEKALLMPQQGGANNLRYQPYRIFNSRGHSGDQRISCTACHDPHDKLNQDSAFYDSKCLACHLSDRGQAKTATRAAPACPVSKRDCATCHMPKIELPGAHNKFTDHWIRVVQPGEAVPK